MEYRIEELWHMLAMIEAALQERPGEVLGREARKIILCNRDSVKLRISQLEQANKQHQTSLNLT